MSIPSKSLRHLRNQFESQGKRLSQKMRYLSRFVSARQVIFPQIPKLDPVLDDMINPKQDPVGNCHNGLLCTPAGFESVILVLEAGALLLDRHPGHLQHSGLQMMLSDWALAALALSGALIIAGTQTAPRDQCPVCRKTIQGGADLRQNIAGRNIDILGVSFIRSNSTSCSCSLIETRI